MATIPITVVEVEPFPARAAAIWSDDDRDLFVDFVAKNPHAGSVIPGTGGVRKVRGSRPGTGKRGGARQADLFADCLCKEPPARFDPCSEARHDRAHRSDQSRMDPLNRKHP